MSFIHTQKFVYADICAQKIKVKILVFNLLSSLYIKNSGMYLVSLNKKNDRLFFVCAVLQFTLFTPRVIAFFLIWQQTSRVYT